MPRHVLLVGESWISVANHYKGFDHFSSTTFHLGATEFVAELEKEGDFAVTYMKAHEVADGFPFERSGLDGYDAIILSDIGANSFLLPGGVWLQGRPMPDRLKLIRDWTADGGGLMMVGGYLTFQGIDAKARWHRTPVEAALPVTCLPFDDRIEVPEGFSAEIAQPDHPILTDIAGDWPPLLGANEIVARDGAEVIARLPEACGGHPLLVTGRFGRGRTLAWASDIGPHWLPETFSAWDGAGPLWRNMLKWLSGDLGEVAP
jgi:uncharacterized membrane protein